VTTFALRSLLSRKVRTALTAVAIVLGVAMMSGTYVLTDSISNAFDAIFTQSYRGTDAVISGKSAFDLSNSGSTQTIDAVDTLIGGAGADFVTYRTPIARGFINLGGGTTKTSSGEMVAKP
jgi:hypothetical protein